MSKQIEQIAREQTKTPSMPPYLDKYYLENLPPKPLLSTPIGKYTAQKLTTNKLANTNHAGMEHILLLVITIGSQELAIGRVRLDYALIHSNKVNDSIDIWGHSDQEIPLRQYEEWY